MHRVKQIKIYRIITISYNIAHHWCKMTHQLIIIYQIFLLITDRINLIIQPMEAACHLMSDIEIISFNQDLNTHKVQVDKLIQIQVT
jgi:hypothetical protein